MTSYMLFTGLGILIYGSAALAETAMAGFGDTRVAIALCSAQCGEDREGFADDQRRSQSAVGGVESEVVATGRKLFQQRGCVVCHNADATGVGPRLDGLFGRPVQDPASGVAMVDESYLREAILNPSAIVALGYEPVMPTFAGLLTEEELQALIEYLKSLSERR